MRGLPLFFMCIAALSATFFPLFPFIGMRGADALPALDIMSRITPIWVGFAGVALYLKIIRISQTSNLTKVLAALTFTCVVCGIAAVVIADQPLGELLAIGASVLTGLSFALFFLVVLETSLNRGF